jgi:hypothetical protein
LDLTHARDEHRDEALPHPVLGAEFGQSRVEVVAVVEVNDKRPPLGHFSRFGARPVGRDHPHTSCRGELDREGTNAAGSS